MFEMSETGGQSKRGVPEWLRAIGLALVGFVVIAYALTHRDGPPVVGMEGAPECEIVAQQLRDLGRTAEIPANCR